MLDDPGAQNDDDSNPKSSPFWRYQLQPGQKATEYAFIICTIMLQNIIAGDDAILLPHRGQDTESRLITLHRQSP